MDYLDCDPDENTYGGTHQIDWERSQIRVYDYKLWGQKVQTMELAERAPVDYSGDDKPFYTFNTEAEGLRVRNGSLYAGMRYEFGDLTKGEAEKAVIFTVKPAVDCPQPATFCFY